MRDTIHHLPGRLRVRLAALYRNAPAAAAARRDLLDRPGILEVEVNPLTGSLLAFYDPRRISAERILEALDRVGLPAPRDSTSPFDQLVDTAVSAALDRVVEHGAALLLASLI